MTERKKTGIYLKDNIWAENKPNECTEPNKGQYPFTENEGWGTPFSEAGGSPVERTTMNRNFNKIGALGYDVNRFGSNLPWDGSVAYEVGALVIGSDNKTYRAAQASTGQDPVNDKSGTNWKFAIFNSITGTDNIKVTADAKNNLTVDTAVNLNTKANANLDNVASGTIKGKFADTTTIRVNSNSNHVNFVISPNSINSPLLSTNAVTSEKITKESVSFEKLDSDVVLKVMQVIYPIGDTKTMYNNNQPPFQGKGMKWELLGDGYAVITTTNNDAGTTLGINRLDTGNTEGHALTVGELADHNHQQYTVSPNYPVKEAANPRYVFSTSTAEGKSLNYTYSTLKTGANEPHKHKLDVKTIKMKMWRRTA